MASLDYQRLTGLEEFQGGEALELQVELYFCHCTSLHGADR